MRVLVTGAASGIGAAIVRRFVLDGAEVRALDLDGAALDTMRTALKDDGLDAGRVEPLVADLSRGDAIDGLPADIDVLVNNAGLQHVAPVHEFPPEAFEHIHRVMLLAPFLLARHVLPHMYARRWGRVVNVSSVHGLRASPFKSAYVSAKHGLEGLSKVIALEGAEHGVTSNCINPAYVRTPLVERQIADQAKAHGIPESQVIETVMLAPAARKRLIEPAEVAAFAAFLCTPTPTRSPARRSPWTAAGPPTDRIPWVASVRWSRRLDGRRTRRQAWRMLTIGDVRLVACSVPRTTEDLVQGRVCFRVSGSACLQCIAIRSRREVAVGETASDAPARYRGRPPTR